MTKGGRGAPRQRRDTREGEGQREHHARRTEMATAGREDSDSNLGDDPRVGVVNSADGNSNGRDGVGSGDRDTREEGQEERELAKAKYQNKVELWISPDDQQTFLGKACIERMREMDDKRLDAVFIGGLIPGEEAQKQLSLLVLQFRAAYPQTVPPPTRPDNSEPPSKRPRVELTVPRLKEYTIQFVGPVEDTSIPIVGEGWRRIDKLGDEFSVRMNFFGNRFVETLYIHMGLGRALKPTVYVLGQVPKMGKTSLCLMVGRQWDRLVGPEEVENCPKSIKEAAQKIVEIDPKLKLPALHFYAKLGRDSTAQMAITTILESAFGEKFVDDFNADEVLLKKLAGRLNTLSATHRIYFIVDEFQAVSDIDELKEFLQSIAPIADCCRVILAGASIQMLTGWLHRVSEGGTGVNVLPLVLPPIARDDWRVIFRNTLTGKAKGETIAARLLNKAQRDDPKNVVNDNSHLSHLINRLLDLTGGVPGLVIQYLEDFLAFGTLGQTQHLLIELKTSQTLRSDECARDVSVLVTLALGCPQMTATEILTSTFGCSEELTNRDGKERICNAILLSGLDIVRCDGSNPKIVYRFSDPVPPATSFYDVVKSALTVQFVNIDGLKNMRFKLTAFSVYRAAVACGGTAHPPLCDSRLTDNFTERKVIGLLARTFVTGAPQLTLAVMFPVLQGCDRKPAGHKIQIFAGAQIRDGSATHLPTLAQRAHHRTESETGEFTNYGIQLSPSDFFRVLETTVKEKFEQDPELGALIYGFGAKSNSGDILAVIKLLPESPESPSPSGRSVSTRAHPRNRAGASVKIKIVGNLMYWTFQVKAIKKNLSASEKEAEYKKMEKTTPKGGVLSIAVFNRPGRTPRETETNFVNGWWRTESLYLDVPAYLCQFVHPCSVEQWKALISERSIQVE